MGMIELKYPRQFVDLTSMSKDKCRETRPLSDVIFHLFLFKYRVLGDGTLFQKILHNINAEFLSWDRPFQELGQDPETEVLKYCRRWGVPESPWPWSKPASAYQSMNDWFCRSYWHQDKLAPEQLASKC